MNDISPVLNQIIECLLPTNPYKIVLFGSYAKGNPHKDSDIDIMVILDNDNVAKTYAERRDEKLAVNLRLFNINEQVPLDTVIYTRAEWKIVSQDNPFIDEIEETGKVIYEK